MNLKELRTALQERREDYSESTAKLNRRLNQSYLDICSRRKWGWLRRECAYATYASFESAAGPPVVGFSVAGTQDGNVHVAVTGNIPDNTLGKRIRIDDDYYRVENINAGGNEITLDRPLRCTVNTGTPPATATHYVKVLYHEVALPVGTLTVVESTLFKGGSTSYGTPLGMGAVTPARMSHLDKDVQGTPTGFSVTRKEPIPRPRSAPTLASPSTGTGLSVGTYTYWYTHFDKQTGAESSLGVAATVKIEVAGTAQVVVSGTVRNDLYYKLYRSTVNGGVPYLIQSGNSGTINHTDSLSDDYLTQRGPASASSMYMQFYPIPDGEYEVSTLVQFEAKRMDEDEDRPMIDAQFHNVILDGAEAMMLEASDEQGRAGSSRKRYEMGIARMIQADRLNQQSRVVFGGRSQERGKPAWRYAYGSTEADFKA